MTARVWPADSVDTNADGIPDTPSYSGRALRQTAVAAAAAMGSTARPLGSVSGVRPGTPSSIVTATSTTWTVTPFMGVIDGEASALAGGYEYAFDANVTGSVTAAGASPRVDRLDVQISDHAESDGTGATTPPFPAIIYTVGTPGLAAAPARSHPLAQINVPASGGGSPTVTWTATYFAAPGALIPALSSALYPSTPYSGMQVDDATIGHPNRYNGTAWANPALTPLFADRGTGPSDVVVSAVSTWQNVTSVSVTGASAGGVCEVRFDACAKNVSGTANYYTILYQVLCDGVAVSGTRTQSLPGVSGLNPLYSVGYTFRHTPAAGTHTWTLQHQCGAATVTATNFASLSVVTS